MPGPIELGRVIGAFGIRGWIRLQSHTAPPDAILRYRHWRVGGRDWKVVEGHAQGTAVVASLEGLDDRDAAAALRGATIEVDRAELPKTKPREFYWADMLGAKVVSLSGVELGRLSGLTSNGAQDVMVVSGDRERLIPFVAGAVVKQVDLKAGLIVVDWSPDD